MVWKRTVFDRPRLGRSSRSRIRAQAGSRAALVFVSALVCLVAATDGLAVEGWTQYSAAIHVHSSFSNGQYDIEQLARLAQQRDVDVVIVTDSFLTTATYGFWPFDRVGVRGINKVVRPGVRDHGVENYLERLAEAQQAFPDVLLVPGVEVTPYYYWTGSPWTGLTLHDFDRHLLVLGLEQAELENLPVIGNVTWSNSGTRLDLVLFPSLLFLFGMGLLFAGRPPKLIFASPSIKQRYRVPAVVFLALGVLLGWYNYPFGTFGEPHSGQHSDQPYQRLIDYVTEAGGVVYWSYPEARYSDVTVGSARMVSAPHESDLLLTDGYHGFEGIYGDRITATQPGRTWDSSLMEYLRGSRRSAPFVTTGIDFHYLKNGGQGWYDLDGGLTFLLMKERSREAVLEALRTGRTYATFQMFDQRIQLAEFSVETWGGGKATAGQRAAGKSPLKVRVSMDWLGDAPETVETFRIQVILNGRVVDEVEHSPPVDVATELGLPPGEYYLRLKARSTSGYEILSNPVFVTIAESLSQSAARATPDASAKTSMRQRQ